MIAGIVVASIAVVVGVILAVYFGVFYSHGESGVDKDLQSLNIEPKLVIHDLIIPYRDRSSQIDNILLTKKGIYVIECKSYRGDIVGKVDDVYWYEKTITFTKNLHFHTHKYKMYNPLKQNNTHINALSKLLNVNKECFRSLVVFIRAIPQLDKTCPEIATKQSFCSSISEYESKTQDVFSDAEFERILSILVSNKTNPRVTKSEHVSNVKKNHDTNKMIY